MSHYEGLSKVEMVNEDITYHTLVSERAYRSLRGGAFNHPPVTLRSSSRARFQPSSRLSSVGFRVARTYN
jgi:formylglycine-generating enzyme required for sulfatase activity